MLCKKDNNGFTFVELIVVIVILAILASIMVPTMLSYLDDSDDESLQNNARLIALSAQNKFSELYLISSHDNGEQCIISGQKGTDFTFNNNANLDCDIHDKQIAADIFKNAGLDITMTEPYYVVIGAGRYDQYTNPELDTYDPKKAYTIYSITILNTENEKVWYWTTDKGFTRKKPYFQNKVGNLDYYYNETNFNGESIMIQYYMLKNGPNNDKKANEVWTILNSHQQK